MVLKSQFEDMYAYKANITISIKERCVRMYLDVYVMFLMLICFEVTVGVADLAGMYLAMCDLVCTPEVNLALRMTAHVCETYIGM